MALVVLLAVVPLVLPLVARWSLRLGPLAGDPKAVTATFGAPFGVGPAAPQSPLTRDLRLGLRRALVDAYRPEVYWWEAVLMLQRLVRHRATVCIAMCVSPCVPPFFRSSTHCVTSIGYLVSCTVATLHCCWHGDAA